MERQGAPERTIHLTDATYLNLGDHLPIEFHAKGDEDTGEQDFFIPKTEVPYEIWNRLLAAVGSPQPVR
jgi:hypothetical protein